VKAGVAFATLRVEDSQGRPPPRRAVAIAGDHRLRALPDDVAAQPDPRPPGELEPETGRLGDGGRQAPSGTTGLSWRFEHDEERLRAPGERREPGQPVGDAGRTIRGGQPAAGQVEDQEIDRASGQKHAPDSEALVQRLRGDDDEPLEADPAGDGLDRVEAAREIQPGHDRALCLGLGREPQDQRRPPARTVAADRDARRSRKAAWPEDRVECREAGVDDAIVVGARQVPGQFPGERRFGR
jgi:hypothetical protein